MFSKIISNEIVIPENAPKEGDLYKVVTVFGKTFELRYGYYGESDKRYEPDVIYPDFLKEPLYTEEGEPFATMIQDACMYYMGEKKRTPDSTCADCKYFKCGEEWIGICKCPENKNTNNI